MFQPYVPQLHVLGILEGEERPEINFDTNLDRFYSELDLMIEEKGEKEAEIAEVEN